MIYKIPLGKAHEKCNESIIVIIRNPYKGFMLVRHFATKMNSCDERRNETKEYGCKRQRWGNLDVLERLVLTEIKGQFLVLSGAGKLLSRAGKLLSQAVGIAPASLGESAVGK